MSTESGQAQMGIGTAIGVGSEVERIHLHIFLMEEETLFSAMHQSRGQQTIFLKGQIINSLDFAGYMVFATATQPCYSSGKVAIDITLNEFCVPTKLYLQKRWWAGFGLRAIVC